MTACHDSNSELTMYFTVNKAFVNYLDQFDNLTDSLDTPPILMDKTTFQQTTHILDASKFDSTLLAAPQTLKDFIHECCKKKEIFDLNERHITTNLEMP